MQNKYDPSSVMIEDEKKLPGSGCCEKWQASILKSQQKVIDRQKLIPPIKYPEFLPVSQKRQEIKKLISDNQVLVLAGETGSGKTTQLPKMCLELGLANRGLIGHTQPRRLAAHTIAQRISEELNTNLGECVGYQVRFLDKTNPSSLVKLMTDGILLSEIKNDPLLLKYQVIIIDEAHERSLNIDFLLGYLKRILPKRPDLKLIITSATINVELFSNHFNKAPVFEISGRGYPIETVYMGDDSDLDTERTFDLPEKILNSIKRIEKEEAEQKSARTGGNILVFLACERDIKDTQLRLKKNGYLQDQIYPLFARLSKKEQIRIFERNSRYRKIILSTNIAETSLTIPGVNYVIDSGQVRLSRYNFRSKVQQLPIENISKASANQRQGRCGREGPGRCYRLFSEQEFELMREETEAEILRTNLASVLLMSLELNIGALSDFPFVEQPDPRFIKDAFTLLDELQALTHNRKLSKIGKRLAHLSIDPRLGRMILASQRLNCLSQVIVIAGCLAIQDPREFPSERQDYSRQMHARFDDKNNRSDFNAILLLWCYFQAQKKSLSKSALRKKLGKECLNVKRLFEWEELVHQLSSQMKNPYQIFSEDELSLANVHRACLSGLLSNIGKKDESKEFIGARNKRFIVFPGSSLYKKPPEWLMASFLVETDKLYARMCAPFETPWLLDYAKHLIKHNYSEPHWSKKHKRAMVYKSSLLFGLTILDKERITLSAIDKSLARELFIKEIFVNDAFNDYILSKPLFWLHNQKLRVKIFELESKSRRLDILLDDESLYELYDKHINSEVYDINSFNKWLKDTPEEANKQLSFNQRDLMQHSGCQITTDQFPNSIKDLEQDYKLSYYFEPNALDDGVSVIVPIQKLIHCNEDVFTWLVPGLLEEKCVALLKLLPKSVRKCLMPIPDLVQNILFDLTKPSGNLFDFLEYKLKEIKNLRISKEDFNLAKCDDFYFMNFKVVDENNILIEQGRDLSSLKRKLNKLLEKTINKQEENLSDDERQYKDWHSLDCAFERSIKQEGFYLSLVLKGEASALKLLSCILKADFETRKTLVFFARNYLKKEVRYIEKNIFKSKHAVLSVSRQSNLSALKQQIIDCLLEVTFFSEGALPKTCQFFETNIKQHQSMLMENFQRMELALISTFQLKQEIESTIVSFNDNYKKSIEDINFQLEQLFTKNYPLLAGEYLLYYPRYLKAIKTRLEKLPRNEINDISLMAEIGIYETKLSQKISSDELALYTDLQLKSFRYLLEEFRISLFDQTIKTREKVSLKRLEKLWEKLA